MSDLVELPIETCVIPKEPQLDPPLSLEESALIANLSETDVRSIDTALLAEASSQWRKVARVVGAAMSRQPTRIPGIPDLFYAQRVHHLVGSGLLEAEGDLRFMGRSEVRLPSGAMTPTMLLRFLAVVGLLVLFGAVMIGANHGAGPIGLLLVIGRDKDFVPGQVLGWIGVLLCVGAVFRRTRRGYLGTLLFGLGFLVLSVVAFAIASDTAVATLIFSVPLLGASLFVVVRYRSQHGRAQQSS